MSELKRAGISLEKELLEQFDRLIKKKGYQNRSEAIRDLIRAELAKEGWESEEEAVGVLTVVYDHHLPDLTRKLTAFQHDFEHLVVSTLHVHLDHHNCLEAVVLRGKGKELQEFADKMISIKGVKHGQLLGTKALK